MCVRVCVGGCALEHDLAEPKSASGSFILS